MNGLAENLGAVSTRIRSAAAAAGRTAERVRLVAVTKSVGADRARELFALGTLDLGESRADELERKHAALAGAGLAPRWHFIGHVQGNKARRVARLAWAIHSVDSRALLERLARLRRDEGISPELFLEVKLAPDAAKTGFARAEVEAALAHARALGLPVRGLMTMAPEASAGTPAARASFDELAALAASLPPELFAGGRAELSMGMSQDFEEAIAAGADWVRVGSALFEGLDAAPGAGP